MVDQAREEPLTLLVMPLGPHLVQHVQGQEPPGWVQPQAVGPCPCGQQLAVRPQNLEILYKADDTVCSGLSEECPAPCCSAPTSVGETSRVPKTPKCIKVIWAPTAKVPTPTSAQSPCAH